MTLKMGVRNFFIFTLSITLTAIYGGVSALATESSYLINTIAAEKRGDSLTLRIKGSSQPTYTVYELFDPLRVVIDIADASFSEAVQLPLSFASGPLASVNGRIESGKNPELARLEFFLAAEHNYTVERKGSDIVATFLSEVISPSPSTSETGSEAASPEAAIIADLLRQNQQGEGTADLSMSDPEPAAPETDFSNSGYNKMGISIDFYKIDLHNVFRLFGEISGLNIVIAEGVSGTLTLALNNVPWDFALDVILNLKNLRKIERFGTIVISPKDMEFEWPEKPVENLAIKAGAGAPITVTAPSAGTGTQGETVSVKQEIEVPEQVIAARKIGAEGRGLEKKGNIDGALALYEKSFAMWPEDGVLAKRIASLYLVRKGVNAKASYYAKAALEINPKDRDAAHIGAIGEANMMKIAEAKELFELAVQEDSEDGSPPSSEALISYAGFNEENGNNMGALLLLDRHEQTYGDTVETMVAKARIHDKEGNSSKALAEYQSILLSGFELPPDLVRYINGRITLQSQGQKLR